MKRFLPALALVSFVLVSSAQAHFLERVFLERKQMQAEQGQAAYAKYLDFSHFERFLRNPFGPPPPQSGVFDQLVDHFNKNDDRVFAQRYWIDSSNARAATSPVIYSVCGESRCRAAGGFAAVLAREIGAHIVTLEHRYYGESIPVKTYSAKNLSYLSTDEALEDLAVFQEYAEKKFGLKGPWITVGGSYAGSLAAYYRLKYTKHTVGALASSGPVEAHAKFEEYDYQVATVVPPTCLRDIQDASDTIEKILHQDDAARQRLKRLFKSEKIENDLDFLYVVAEVAAISVQYGSREDFCRELGRARSKDELIEIYADLGMNLFASLRMTPLEDTATGNLSENVDRYTDHGMRQWYYQSCTEFGYWQIAYHDPNLSARSPRIDLKFHDGICERMFGITRSVDTSYINRTYYEPLVAGRGSQILFTNGSDDPWKVLSIVPGRRNVPRSVNAVEIRGAAHCDDLASQGSPEVQKAQNLFRDLVREWLK